MSRHWNPKGNVHRLPARKRRRRSGTSWPEFRLMMLAGLFVGLGYQFVGQEPSSAADVTTASGATRVDDAWAVSVTDGDTFRYAGEKIRIADIDTPEVRGRCAYETDLAAKATDRMEALLHEGPFEMHPIPGRDEDRYGRKLRVIVRDGRSLGDQLVSEGLARTWSGRREPWCS